MLRTFFCNFLLLVFFTQSLPWSVTSAQAEGVKNKVLNPAHALQNVEQAADELADLILLMQMAAQHPEKYAQIKTQANQKLNELYIKHILRTSAVSKSRYLLNETHVQASVALLLMGTISSLLLTHYYPNPTQPSDNNLALLLLVTKVIGYLLGSSSSAFVPIHYINLIDNPSLYFKNDLSSQQLTYKILNRALVKQLRRRGIKAPYKNTDSWLSNIIEGPINSMVLLSSKSLMIQELDRIHQTLSNWIAIFNQKNLPARAAVIADMQRQIPSGRNWRRHLPSDKWLHLALERRNQMLVALKKLGPQLGLTDPEFQLSEFLNYQPLLAYTHQRSLSAGLIAANPTAELALVKLKPQLENLNEFSLLLQALQSTLGQINFKLNLDAPANSSAIAPTRLINAQAELIINDGPDLASNLAQKQTYREAAFEPLNQHSLKFSFEFASAQKGDEAIINEGHWLEPFLQTLSQKVGNDSSVLARMAVKPNLRVAPTCETLLKIDTNANDAESIEIETETNPEAKKIKNQKLNQP